MADFQEKIIHVWNGWEIRTLVLLSLLLQINLIKYGSKRKYIARRWISIMIWLVYLSADWVATVTLGHLARSDFVSTLSSNIQIFWAPFLLLHLGGPDTITSFALEDNTLWLRHLLGLVVEVSVAFYVYFSSWTNNNNNNPFKFAAIPVFVSGIIKYGERTWCLMCSNSNYLQENLISTSSTKKKNPKRQSCPSASTHYFHKAHHLFKMSLHLFEDLILGFSELKDSYSIISSVDSDEAFKMVEIELGLIYDRLYTKMPIVYSKSGLLLRFLCLSSIVIAFIFFRHISMEQPDLSTVDVAITYILLVGGIVLEVYALFYLIRSDWTKIWLLKKFGDPVFKSLMPFNNGKRWSRSIAQYNLISCCRKMEPPKLVKFFHFDEILNYMEISWKNVNDVSSLKESIFNHVLKKGDKLMNEIMGRVFNAQALHESLISWKGNSVIEERKLGQKLKEFMGTISFDHSILIWHIATDLCYYVDLDENQSHPKFEISKRLSDYMMYLLVMSPNMLPKGNHSIRYAHQDTEKEIKYVLVKEKKKYTSQKEACIELLKANFTVEEEEVSELMSVNETKRSVLAHACVLAKELMRNNQFEERWEGVCEVWIEMIAYAACHCEWKDHAQQLSRGGEFLTHVCLLMAHLGLNDQFIEFHVKVP